SFGDQHEHVFKRGFFFGETKEAAVGGGQLTEEALDIGLVAVKFERAAAAVEVDVAELRIAADEADAGLWISVESDLDVAIALDLAVDGLDRAVQQKLAAVDDAYG